MSRSQNNCQSPLSHWALGTKNIPKICPHPSIPHKVLEAVTSEPRKSRPEEGRADTTSRGQSGRRQRTGGSQPMARALTFTEQLCARALLCTPGEEMNFVHLVPVQWGTTKGGCLPLLNYPQRNYRMRATQGLQGVPAAVRPLGRPGDWGEGARLLSEQGLCGAGGGHRPKGAFPSRSRSSLPQPCTLAPSPWGGNQQTPPAKAPWYPRRGGTRERMGGPVPWAPLFLLLTPRQLRVPSSPAASLQGRRGQWSGQGGGA